MWYLQEVEGVRTDVRIVNTSLLGTDWYIDQMQYKTYESEPLPFSIPRHEYIYGTNDVIEVVDRVKRPVMLKEVIDLISNPAAKVRTRLGGTLSYFAARQLLIPVDKQKAVESGIIDASEVHLVPDTIQLDLPERKNSMIKSELMILDLLANYKWDRPIYFVAMGGDLEIGIRDYLEYNGFAYKFVPIKNKSTFGNPGRVNPDVMYNLVMNVYRWGNMNDPTVNIDYQNLLTFNAVLSGRNIFSQTAGSLLEAGDTTRAVEVLDRMQEVMIPSQFPLNGSAMSNSLNELAVIESIDTYLVAGELEKGSKLADLFADETIKSIKLFSKPFRGRFISKNDIESNLSYLHYLQDIFANRGFTQESEKYEKMLNDLYSQLQAM